MVLIGGLVLSGCQNAQPITAESEGIWNHFFVYPLSWLIIFMAEQMNGSYGLAIIIVTILIRLILLPLMLQQNKNTKAMRTLQPEMEAIKKRYATKDQKSQQKLQQEMLELYKTNGVNPVGGCLPIFIQLPIMMAFYYAIMRTEEIALHTFLWFDLGNPDPLFILPVVAASTTYLQTKMTMSTLPDNMKITMYIMPIMILVAAVAMPSALSLYWVIGNLFMVIQSYFVYYRKDIVNG
ncbi:membrane protein insertase YidC [Bacillus sp. FJAT-45350]|uniref:membrane protein insertase YidC n=1 Tax=Bacillus sp. FJAT-45350 TaxID=2011014 RepID=UPI000BB8F1B2